jgi:hypothetical protein
MTVNSPGFYIQEGKVVGDIVVNAEGFSVDETKINGNVIFATQEYADTAEGDVSLVSGTITIAEAPAAAVNPEDFADVVASATPTEMYFYDEETITAALSANGQWIANGLADVTMGDLTVDGEFTHREEVARKMALYEQDDERNVTAAYTLTVDSLTVNSPGFYIQEGKVVGDIIVNAEGFRIVRTEVDGNITFASQELMDSAEIDEALVSGEISVAE